eukprot:2031861-Ditylum_brightwellii.AAC.1
MQKPLRKKIACAIKELDNLDGKKPKSHHERCHGLGKRYEKHYQNNVEKESRETIFPHSANFKESQMEMDCS